MRHLSLALCSRFYRSIDISDKKSLLRKRIDKAFRQELRISVFDSHYADAQIPCQIPFGRELLFGKPSLLIVKGEIDQAQMRRNRFTLDELMQELRSQGVTDIRMIEYAVLETDGKLSLLRSPAASPVTASQLDLPEGSAGYPHIVISDGRVLEANLCHLGLDTAWLDNTLHEQGYASPAEVYLMTVDEGKAFFLARKEATIA